ncbi:MAG: RnfABCDGE type electron transport complex subunit D [Treponemataceae bacterium]|nr:RnfABCDGE type electron transport complex subunit D [Treponemataceae bacterium]
MKNNFTRLRIEPFIHITPSIRTTSMVLCILLLPQLVFLAVQKSYSALFVIFASLLASYSSELLANYMFKKKTLHNLTAMSEGLIIGMFLPETFPVIEAFFIVFISLLIFKHFFGGLASNWANPMAITIIIAWFCGSVFFPQSQITRTMLESANPASALFAQGILPNQGQTSAFTDFINGKVFSHLGIMIPDGYSALFWDSHSLIPAFRFNLFTLAASILLISFSMMESLVPAVYLLVYGVLVRFFSLTPFTGSTGNGDIFLALLTSGTLFCAFFMLPYYGTMPLSTAGKMIYGCIAGILAFLISGCGLSSVGSVFTVIAVNAISPLIQFMEEKCYTFFRTDTLQTREENER